MKMNGRKIGRNEVCPCGSGRKFKRCCGDLNANAAGNMERQMQGVLQQAEALELQRVRQQGKGAPIISTESSGTRFVTIKNRMVYSKSWKTFHDFLGDYIKVTVGVAWGNAEIAKPADQRHPIISWYQLAALHQLQGERRVDGMQNLAMTGAIAAYLQLAYDLYALAHNADLQEQLLRRLRDNKNFFGARYEVQVAAVLIRAGFDIVFENESDKSSTHCEFTAMHKGTGRRFSVEAKHSDSGVGRLMRQVNRGLSKHAKHQKIVFVDVNTPDDGVGDAAPGHVERARALLRRYEETDPAAKKHPPTYIIATNTPWALHPHATNFRSSVWAFGLHFPHFREDAKFASIGDAVRARDAHRELHDVLVSLKENSSIPSTFDGQLPEVAFGQVENRLLVGGRYDVSVENGMTQLGVLESGAVLETERMAACVFKLDNGRRVINKVPLTDAEMAVHRSSPDTFFGVVGGYTRRIDDPIELYDWLLTTYSKTPKAKLLEFLQELPNYSELKNLPQAELARVYCEGMATVMYSQKQAAEVKP